MSTDSWLGGIGNWTNGADWSEGNSPNPTDDVVIGVKGSDVTLDTAATVASLTIGSGTVSAATLDIANSSGADTVTGNVTNYGTIGLHDSKADSTNVLATDGGFSNSGTLDVDSGSGEGGSSLTVADALNNAGTIQVGNSTLNAATTITLGSLTNAARAKFIADGSSAHAVTLDITGGTDAFSGNAGTFDLAHATALTLNESSSFANASTGIFAIHNDTTLTVDGGFANSGALDIDSGSGQGGSGLTVTGALNNTGAIQAGNSTLNAATTIAFGSLTNGSGANFSASGSSAHNVTLDITGGTDAFSSNAGTFNLAYATPLTLDESSSFTNDSTGIFGIHNDTSLTVDGGFANGGTLDVDSGSSEGGSGLTVTGALNNIGTIQIGNGGTKAATDITLASLTNASGAKFGANGSSAHTVTLAFTGGTDAFSSNSGTFNLANATALTLDESSSFTNASTGIFGIHNGTALTVDGGFSNSGILDVDSGSGEGGSSLTVTGAMNNTGTIQAGNGTLNAATNITLDSLTNGSGAKFTANGSSAHAVTLAFNGGSNAFSSNAGTFNLTYATALTLNESSSFTNTNTGTFGIHSDTALTVDGGFANSGTLDVDSVGAEGGSSLTVTGALNNTGTIQIGNGTLNAATAITLASLTNASGAKFSANGSSTHTVTLAFTGGTNAFSSNAGTFNLTYATPLTLSESSSFTNAGNGTFGIHNGTALTVDGGFANSGTLDVDSVSGEGGSSLTVTGILNNAKNVQIGSGGLKAATDITLGGLINGSGANFTANGAAAHAVTLAFTGGTNAFSSNAGTFNLTYATALTLNESISFTNASTGIFGIHNDTALTVDGGFANSGTLNVDSGGSEGGSSLTVTGALNNTGTIQIGNGSAKAVTDFTLANLTNASGAKFSASGSSAHVVTLEITGGSDAFSSNAGTFNLTYATPLTLNESISFTNASTGIFGIHNDTALTVDGGFANSGTLNVDSGGHEGGSSLTVTGALNNSSTIQIGNSALNAATSITLGNLTNGSGANFTASGSSAYTVTLAFSGGTDAFSSNAGAFNLSHGAMSIEESSSFTNAGNGTFGIHNGTTLTVDGGFANNGTLDVDSGSGESGSSLTVTGVLNNAKIVQIGNSTLNAATDVTLGGLINGSGAKFSASGSSAHAVTLDVTGGTDAFSSNAGTFNLIYAAALTLDESSSFTNASTGVFGIHNNTALTVDGGFANNGTLDVDSGSHEGGSSLTVTGILNNSKDVQIGNGGLKSATDITLGGLINGSGANFTANGSTTHIVTLAFTGGAGAFSSNAGTFDLSRAAMSLDESSSFSNIGIFGIHKHTTLTVDGGFANSGTLDVDSGTGEGGSSLTVTGTLNNTSTIQIGNSTLNAGTDITLGGLTNAAGASISLDGFSSNYIVTLAFTGGTDAFSSNAGTFNLSYGAMSLEESGRFTNTGIFGIHDDTALTVDGGFANSGTLDVDSGTGEGGSSLTVTGTLNNTSAIQVGNSTLKAATDITLGGLTNGSGAYFTANGYLTHIVTLAFTGGTDVFSGNAGIFNLSCGAMSLAESSSFANTGIFGIHDDTILTVDGGFANSGTLDVDSGSGEGGSSLTVTGTLKNTSTIQIGIGSLNAATTVTLGSFTNSGGASISLDGSSSKHIVTLAFTGGTDAFSSNAGTFDMSHGAMSLDESGSFSNTGIFGIRNDTTLTVNGGIANSGTLDVDSGSGQGGSSLTVTGTLNNTSAIQIGNGTLNAATNITLGNLTNGSGASFSLTGGQLEDKVALSVSGDIENDGTFTAQESTSLTVGGNLTNATDATMSINGAPKNAATLSVSGGVTNDGIFAAYNEASLFVGGNLINSVTFDIDSESGKGGSSLTVTGELNNTGTVQIGNSSLSAATNLTLGALDNESGATFALEGSSKYAVTIDITGSGSDAGSLDIGSNIQFTGPGAVFTQTAGETFVTGKLIAPTINLEGGTLDGTGTVAGSIGSTAGAIAGGSVGDAAPGTLIVIGNYVCRTHQSRQGGTANVIVLLAGTSASQVGSIAVTGGVDLQGGELQVDAVGSLTLSSGQTFNNVMTFTPGDLQGSFSELVVGDATGNGTYVNLGNNLTLGALYNVAAGNITLEVVATPLTTADNWTGTTGNWSTLNDWSVRVPTFYSDVTIGSNSTVTLSQDATIDSLTLNSGATLDGSGSSLTVGANVSLNSGAALTITNLAVGGTFTDDGSVTISGDGALDLLLAGTLGGTGSLALSGGTIAGVSLTAATGSTLTGFGEVDAVFVGAGTVTASGGSWIFTGTGDSFSGVINGSGAVQIDGTTRFGALTIGGTVTVSNDSSITETGQVTLGDATTAAATFINSAGSSYDIAANVGIGVGDAAASLFENAGTLAKTAGTGTSTIAVAVFDSGAIQAASGTLDLTNVVSGTGTMTVDANAALKFTSSAASTLAMNFNGADATLDLSAPSTFAATIGGFGSSDIIDLLKIKATAATPNASDQLVITDGAKTVATLQLTGNYADDTFAVGTDGHGGTDITTTAPQGTVSPVAASQSFSFDQNGQSFTSTGESTNISILNNTSDDTFNFGGHFGNVTIAGYAPGHDTLNFDHGGFANAAAVEAFATQGSHSDTVIALDSADTITLEGVTLVQFEAHSADWHFI